ncbi:MAG: hypothetical protein U9R54_03740, partial [Bacteroidota bacterium]|nr:hypothetical protein [Bacteroidota bacterium]
MKSSKVQTFVVKVVNKKISNNIGAKVTIGRVDYNFINKLSLNDVYISDQKGDTMIYSENIVAYLKRLDISNREVVIKSINTNKLKLNIYNDTSKFANIKFFQEAIKPKDTTKRWNINILNFETQKAKIVIASNRIFNKDYGIDLSNIVFNNLYFRLKNMLIANGDLSFKLKEMSFIEKSGFDVYNLKAKTFIGQHKLSFKNMTLRTPNSYIMVDSIVFKHKNFKEYTDFNNKIKLDIGFNSSNIGFEDLAYFSSEKLKIPYNFILTGRIYGKVKSLRGKNVTFKIGEQTELVSDFSINGLPNINQTFIFFDFKKLTTTAKEIEIINNFKTSGKKILIPENFKSLGTINYRGNFTGFYDDFVTYGKFSSLLGNVFTDISLKPKNNQKLSFNGKVKTENFKIGDLFNSENVDKINFNAQIKGSVSPKDGISAQTKGEIESVVINDYNYQNIIIDGFLTQNTYKGYFNISDPNIKIDFKGDIDFSNNIPEFNFNAKVPLANLYGLKIDKSDSTSNLNFNLNANFIGKNIDNLVGKIVFSEAELTKFNDKLIVDSLLISSKQISDTHNIALRSNYVDANLIGTYQSKTLLKSVRNLFLNYLPAFSNKVDKHEHDFGNDFEL